MSDFKTLDLSDFNENVFDLIPKQWMLITAGPMDDFNTMTASWGGLGHLWGKDVAMVVVRPQRHTFGFMERESHFNLSFLPHQEYLDALMICGTKSGRDIDKMAETGLMPVAAPADTVTFAQARMTMVCRKLYVQDLELEKFIVPDVCAKAYPDQDFHRLYIGEIVACWVK